MLWIGALGLLMGDTGISKQLVVTLTRLKDNIVGGLDMRLEKFDGPFLLGVEPLNDRLALGG